MSKKFFSSVAGASIVIVVFNIISRGFGFFREIICALQFGLTEKYDLFLIGAVVPSFLITVITYLGQNFFIPVYKKIKFKESQDEEIKFLNSSIIIFFTGGILISLVLFFNTKLIINFFLPSASFNQTSVIIFRIFLFSIPLASSSSIISAYLQAEYDFVTPVISQLIVNISIIVFIIFLTGNFSVYSIAIGFLIGGILQFIFLIVKIFKLISFKNIFQISLNNFSFNVLIITILIEIIGQLFLIVDRLFYTSIDSGGLSALNYASNIFVLPIAVLSISFSSALFPKLSHSYNIDDQNELKKNFISGININSFLFIPIFFIFFFWGETLVTLFFQRGEFQRKDTLITADALQYLSFSLIFYSAYAIVNKLIYGISAYKFLLFLYIISIIVKIFLNYFFVSSLKQNGLALSSSISYFILFSGSYFFVMTKLFNKNWLNNFKNVSLNILIGSLSFCIVYVLFLSIKISNNIIDVLKIILFLIIYFISSLIINIEVADLIKDLLLKLKVLFHNKRLA